MLALVLQVVPLPWLSAYRPYFVALTVLWFCLCRRDCRRLSTPGRGLALDGFKGVLLGQTP